MSARLQVSLLQRRTQRVSGALLRRFEQRGVGAASSLSSSSTTSGGQKRHLFTKALCLRCPAHTPASFDTPSKSRLTTPPHHEGDDHCAELSRAQRVAAVVEQLRALAAHRSPNAPNECRVLEGAQEEWNVTADTLADIMEAGAALDQAPVDSAMTGSASCDGSEHVVGTQELPVWETALQLAESAGCESIVAEWLLCVCLRSGHVAPHSTHVPPDVCEGVYQAWRQSLRNAAPAPQGKTSVVYSDRNGNVETSSASSLSIRSPFTPKGLHHHYALWLLREFHSARRSLQKESSVVVHGEDETSIGAGTGLQKSTTTGSSTSNCPDPLSYKSEVVHRSYLLLSRALQVLLVDLPSDNAVAHADGSPSSPQRGRQPFSVRSAKLRPTTALLVLEASRQLAELVADQRTAEFPDCTKAFPLLHYLTNARGQDGVSSPLEDVARAALHQILCNASFTELPAHVAASGKGGKRGVSAPPALQSDGLVQYLGFLMVSSPSPTASVELVEHFMRSASMTARQVAHEPDDRPVNAAHALDGLLGPAREPLGEAIAAAVRVLLTSYTSESASTATTAQSGLPNTTRPVDGGVERAFASVLLHTAPAPLWPLLPLRSAEVTAGEQQFERTDDSDDRANPQQNHRPVSWCAWMLRVLLCDLERAAHTTAVATPHTRIHTTVNKLELWQQQSEWTIWMATRLMMLLKQPSSLASQQPHLRHTHASTAMAVARRPLQEMWRLIFQAALNGCFFHAPSHSDVFRAVPSFVQGHSFRDPRASSDVPLFLRQLCFPHYDKTQWRGPSINLYVRVLDQWGQGGHVKNVFATLARRENAFQADVQAAVAAEAAAANANVPEEETEKGSDTVATSNGVETKGVHNVFRRYRPALHLHSCLITLKYCGCPPRVLAALTDEESPLLPYRSGDERRAPGPHAEENDDADDDGTQLSPTNSEVRLAGEVLQYMLCTLHVVERNALNIALRRVSPDVGTGSAMAVEALATEGRPIAQWVEWVSGCGVPAVEEMYRKAGLEEEWAALGY